MGTTQTTVQEAIDALEALYEFREPDEVRAFLADNPDLFDLLVEAAAKIPEFLPPDGPIVLHVVWDPEDEREDEDELFALVPTRLKWEGIRPLMDRMDREWLIGAGRFAAGRFNVDVEFR